MGGVRMICDNCYKEIKGKAEGQSGLWYCKDCMYKARLAEDRAVDYQMEREREEKEERREKRELEELYE